MKQKFTNPFEELENNHSRSFSESPARRKVQNGIDSHLGTARMLGNIADVYLSRFIGTVIGMAGAKDEQQSRTGESSNSRTKGPNLGKGARYPNQAKK